MGAKPYLREMGLIEKVLDLSVRLMKNRGENKSVAFIILFSVYNWIIC